MTNDRTLTLIYDEDAGQVLLEGHPGGPAGEANLDLAAGVELVFDCADGRLSRVVIETGEPGAATALAAVASLFGSRAREAVEHAPSRDGDPLTVKAEPQIMTAMSRLARLDAVRFTSPVARSPLWSVEAAQLARQAGLATRVNAEARRAVHALKQADDAPTGTLAVAADAIAELVEELDPELAARLRDRAAASRRDKGAARLAQAATGHHPRNRPLGKPDVTDTGNGLPGWLDPRLVPPGLFQHAVRPDTELSIRTEPDRVLVEARLAPGADPARLAQCRARLVDTGTRKVIATAPFGSLDDTRVRAVIQERAETGAWVEVVDDVNRPVSSSQLHYMRRAMRWAQAALSATRQVCGLADAEWVKLAAHAWGRCAEDWSAAGDEDRAYLAAMRRAAIRPGAARPDAPSTWAKEVAGRPFFVEDPFLAERAVGR